MFIGFFTTLTPVDHRGETASHQTRGAKSRRSGSSSGQATGGSHGKIEQTSTGNGKTGVNFINILRAAFFVQKFHTQLFFNFKIRFILHRHKTIGAMGYSNNTSRSRERGSTQYHTDFVCILKHCF
jgi:hypothetical protein